MKNGRRGCCLSVAHGIVGAISVEVRYEQVGASNKFEESSHSCGIDRFESLVVVRIARRKVKTWKDQNPPDPTRMMVGSVPYSDSVFKGCCIPLKQRLIH